MFHNPLRVIATTVVVLIVSACKAPECRYVLRGNGELTNAITPAHTEDVWSRMFGPREWLILRRDGERAVIALLDYTRGVALLLSAVRPTTPDATKWLTSTKGGTLEAWIYRKHHAWPWVVSFDYLQDFWTTRNDAVDPAATRLEGTASIEWRTYDQLSRVIVDLTSTEPVAPYIGPDRSIVYPDDEPTRRRDGEHRFERPLTIKGEFVWFWIDVNRQLLSGK